MSYSVDSYDFLVKNSSMPNTFELPLIKQERANEHDAISFFFDLSSYQEFSFLPGQYIRMMLDGEYEDERGKSRFFSISSSPTVRDHIMITTRIIESGFKKTLVNLEVGTKVKFMGPFGKFIFDESDTRQRIFVAGGIGITPFHSMIVYASNKKLTIPITLFASYSRTEEVLYGPELDLIAKTQTNFKNIITITKPEASKGVRSSETGRISADMIKKYVSNPFECLYFIAGPEALVESLSKIVVDMGVKDDMIITESFPGY